MRPWDPPGIAVDLSTRPTFDPLITYHLSGSRNAAAQMRLMRPAKQGKEVKGVKAPYLGVVVPRTLDRNLNLRKIFNSSSPNPELKERMNMEWGKNWRVENDKWLAMRAAWDVEFEEMQKKNQNERETFWAGLYRGDGADHAAWAKFFSELRVWNAWRGVELQKAELLVGLGGGLGSEDLEKQMDMDAVEETVMLEASGIGLDSEFKTTMRDKIVNTHQCHAGLEFPTFKPHLLKLFMEPGALVPDIDVLFPGMCVDGFLLPGSDAPASDLNRTWVFEYVRHHRQSGAVNLTVLVDLLRMRVASCHTVTIDCVVYAYVDVKDQMSVSDFTALMGGAVYDPDLMIAEPGSLVVHALRTDGDGVLMADGCSAAMALAWHGREMDGVCGDDSFRVFVERNQQ